MVEPSRDRFFVHRVQSAYRLALRDGSAFPDGARESEWLLTRIPDASAVSADAREEIAANGDCLFAIGLKLDVIRRSQPWRSSTPAHRSRRNRAQPLPFRPLPRQANATIRSPAARDRFAPALYICRAYRTAEGRAHRLEAQDVALSRRKQGFDSPWARQQFASANRPVQGRQKCQPPVLPLRW